MIIDNEQNQRVTAFIPARHGRNLGTEKETVQTLTLVCAGKGSDGALVLSTPIVARWYMARRGDGTSPVYCSVWINDGAGIDASGHGRARGYGYHKMSAALDAALASAGVHLARDFCGAGSQAMREALHAVADHLGLPKDRLMVD
jgi:hypothetical protein